ncbi:MAG: ZIP family metal transporter [Thermodesulfobacteriota bacterium]
METQLVNTILYSATACGAVAGGASLVLARHEWATKNSVLFVSFSAGVVLAAAFNHLLPEALLANPDALTVVLLTLVGFYILEHVLAIHSCREHECEVHSIGVPAFAGIALHSLMDGVVIGVGFEAGPSIGLAASAGVVLHKIPVGIAITSILLHSGYEKGKTALMAGVVALATPLGALGAYLLIRELAAPVLGALLAFSAGSFIYIGAADLLPETHKKLNPANILLVLAGVVLVYIIT